MMVHPIKTDDDTGSIQCVPVQEILVRKYKANYVVIPPVQQGIDSSSTSLNLSLQRALAAVQFQYEG